MVSFQLRLRSRMLHSSLLRWKYFPLFNFEECGLLPNNSHVLLLSFVCCGPILGQIEHVYEVLLNDLRRRDYDLFQIDEWQVWFIYFFPLPCHRELNCNLDQWTWKVTCNAWNFYQNYCHFLFMQSIIAKVKKQYANSPVESIPFPLWEALPACMKQLSTLCEPSFKVNMTKASCVWNVWNSCEL
jgi:hypothetical protein